MCALHNINHTARTASLSAHPQRTPSTLILGLEISVRQHRIEWIAATPAQELLQRLWQHLDKPSQQPVALVLAFGRQRHLQQHLWLGEPLHTLEVGLDKLRPVNGCESGRNKQKQTDNKQLVGLVGSALLSCEQYACSGQPRACDQLC